MLLLTFEIAVSVDKTPIRRFAAHWPAVLACIFFFASGRAFLPHLGVQNDEALFAGAYYVPLGCSFITVLGHRIPVMLMTYLGTLKALLFARLDHLLRPSVALIRTPAILAGVATVWLFYILLRRISGQRAAILGCLLLATDTIFFLTTTFDWGPVALQHLLLMGAMVLLMRFYQDGREIALSGAFFLAGLQVWDKAIGLWILSGVGVALMVVFPKPFFRLLTPRRAASALLGFVLGAAPFLAYNLTSDPPWPTFRGNGFDWSDLKGKARLVPNVINGQALLGWLVEEDFQAQNPQGPRNGLQRAAYALSDLSHHPRTNLLWWAFLLSLGLAVFARGAELRGILFSLVAMAVAWAQMAITRGAGGSAHHVVLLWPFPAMIIALSFTAAARRLGRYAVPALAAVAAPVILSCLLLTNQYYVQMIRNGGALNWTDAIYTLTDYVKAVPARFVFVTDWGILDSLRLLGRGRIPVNVGCDPVSKPALSDADKQVVLSWLTVDMPIFVGHTAGNEFFPGAGAMLKKTAAELGYEQEVMAVIRDRYQKPMYEVSRFHPVSRRGAE